MDVLKNTAVKSEGLSTSEVESLREKYGYNEIPKQKVSPFKKVVKLAASPVSLMLIAASFLSLFIGKAFDFYFILSLFGLNLGVAIWQEYKADNAIEKLSEHLLVKTKVIRDGVWKFIDSRELLPGDVIELIVGDLVPADAVIIDSKNLSANESILTGESLPKDKRNGEQLYSGSFIATGWVSAKISATGRDTAFNKTLLSVEKSKKRSALEKDILSTSKFLMTISIIAIVILSISLILTHNPIADTLLLDLSLLIAGVPVALPVVMSIIISLGVLELAKKKAIVRRLSTLEDLANVNLLLTDKTGTLTRNQITVEKIKVYGKISEKEIMRFSSAPASKDENNAINRAILNKYHSLGGISNPKVLSFTPADSERKHASAVFKSAESEILVSIGAPQVIISLCKTSHQIRSQYSKDIGEAAKEGYRVLAVSVSNNTKSEKSMTLAGLLYIADPPRPETHTVINFLRDNGIDVTMLTGDNLEITKRVCSELGFQGIVIPRDKINWDSLSRSQIRNISAFAEILPKDKLRLVDEYKKNHTVAVTGDGVNDLPAMENADVSIAVSNASDALKGSADIVLTSQGIEVIQDAIIESRKIFSRLYSYSVYRISESFRLIMTILILGLIAASFPLTPIQLILLAFLNDIPIMSLAFNHVKYALKPQSINVKSRLILSTLFGFVGILNSLILYFIALDVFHVSLPVLQTMFFLKLTVSGHMLIYVAHTNEKWWKFLPSRAVILATTITQLVATCLAVFGIFMTPIPWIFALFVWVWSFLWMQVSELAKITQQKLSA